MEFAQKVAPAIETFPTEPFDADRQLSPDAQTCAFEWTKLWVEDDAVFAIPSEALGLTEGLPQVFKLVRSGGYFTLIVLTVMPDCGARRSTVVAHADFDAAYSLHCWTLYAKRSGGSLL